MNKGFTLIELLAVIIVLSVIATITLFATGAILKDAKDSLSDAQKTRLIEAAKLYYLENSDIEYVCVQELIDSGYIDVDQVLDPKDRQELDGYISKTRTGNRDRYEYVVDTEGICE